MQSCLHGGECQRNVSGILWNSSHGQLRLFREQREVFPTISVVFLKCSLSACSNELGVAQPHSDRQLLVTRTNRGLTGHHMTLVEACSPLPHEISSCDITRLISSRMSKQPESSSM